MQNNMGDMDSIITLLKAYLIFLIIHEQNHFMKRFFNLNQDVDLCKTPNVKGYSEGGRHLIKLLFGDALINQNLNIEQAKYILDLKNWGKNSVYEFKRDFLKINADVDKGKYIIYLSSSSKSMCDHSKLFS